MRILIIDDDVALCSLIRRHLEKNGDECFCLYTLEGIGSKARAIQPDIILLDISVNDEDGVWTLPTIENAVPFASIIFITSHSESSEMVRALNAGGNYYIKKPLQMDELTAIINSQKRSLIAQDPLIRIGSFTFDKKSLVLGNGRVNHTLTVFESKLLNLLAAHQGNVVTRNEIYLHLWKTEEGMEYSLNNLVHQLRDYFTPDSGVEIETIWGVGYKLKMKG